MAINTISKFIKTQSQCPLMDFYDIGYTTSFPFSIYILHVTYPQLIFFWCTGRVSQNSCSRISRSVEESHNILRQGTYDLRTMGSVILSVACTFFPKVKVRQNSTAHDFQKNFLSVFWWLILRWWPGSTWLAGILSTF